MHGNIGHTHTEMLIDYLKIFNFHGYEKLLSGPISVQAFFAICESNLDVSKVQLHNLTFCYDATKEQTLTETEAHVLTAAFCAIIQKLETKSQVVNLLKEIIDKLPDHAELCSALSGTEIVQLLTEPTKSKLLTLRF